MLKSLSIVSILSSQIIIGEIIGEISFDNRYFFDIGLEEQKRITHLSQFLQKYLKMTPTEYFISRQK